MSEKVMSRMDGYNVTHETDGSEVEEMLLVVDRAIELLRAGHVIRIERVRVPTAEEVTGGGRWGCD